MQIIRGRKALVTGAASGIGRAMALALAREGADLFLVDRDEARLHATAREAQKLSVRVLTRVCDLTRPAEVSACVNAILSAWGTLNILINNAGIAYYGPTHDMTAPQWDGIIAVNLLAPIQFVRELLPTLRTEDEAHILNVCSVFGLVPLRKGAAYQTSKFGLVGLSAALRAEYGREIGVTALCPGFVDTPLLETFASGGSQKRHRIPGWLRASPEHVATVAIEAIRRNRGVVVITPAARLLWFATRFSPRLVDWITRQGWRRRRR
ncbi:MAG TPA: SDR family oxidoreductase [Xanthobacteraceae bacterium]|jgi:short-subunit dehydrogenase|nr:SDR family oxidoreductase [Xanthobacteraceae bacterium]